MQSPKITIITATYNSAQTISDTLESMLKQTYTNIEYIIVDGKSTDGTLKIVKEYEPLFQGRLKWISEKDNGIYDAWNKGIKISTGEWIGFIGSDDVFYSYAISDYVRAIMDNPLINFISSRIELVDDDLKSFRIIGRAWGKQVLIKTHIAHVGALHHKSLFEKKGFYSTQFKVSSDYEFLLRCFDIIVSGFILSVTAKMRCSGISNSSGYVGLKEGLRIKLSYNLRPSILCYSDYMIAVVKYFVRSNFLK